MIYPDGRSEFVPPRIIAINAPGIDPPITDDDVLRQWRDYEAESLLDIIKTITDNDADAINNMLNKERERTLSPYRLIANRVDTIFRLFELQRRRAR